jgi:glutamyl-tRNA synthetase
MHVGNLRTALYEYLIAKSQNGKFVVRIEDTDQGRYVEGAEDIIFRTLKTAGLIHDEGPDIGGPYGPYIQSQRRQIYMDAANHLIESGWAYRCFCAKERLDALHEQDAYAKYDRRCLAVGPTESLARAERGEPYVIRQRVPEGVTNVHDEVYGDVTVNNDEIEDQILIKSDGLPTYNFANVVDDHYMDITHVLRGSEYISSAPKYNLLYNAFGWKIPAYVHLPLITDGEGAKLSKRKGGAASFEDLMEQGFLPEAIINYIALLGWSPGDNREFFTLPELADAFDIRGISKSPSVFDLKKLAWMNGEYIKKMPPDEFYKLALPVLSKAVIRPMDMRKLAAMAQTRVEFVKDTAGLIDFIDNLPEYSTELYVNKKMKTTEEISLRSLSAVREKLKDTPWSKPEVPNSEALHDLLLATAEELGLKNGQVLWPVRIAVSGRQATPCGAAEILHMLGRDESVARIEAGIDKLTRTDAVRPCNS